MIKLVVFTKQSFIGLTAKLEMKSDDLNWLAQAASHTWYYFFKNELHPLMKQLFIFLTAVSLFVVSSCKKDKSESGPNPAKETGQKVLGKWQIISISINESLSGEDHITTHPGTSSDYIEFKTDGKMHTYFKNNLTISDYQIKSVKTITIEGDDHTIRQLTDSTLNMFSTDRTGTIGYTQVNYDLKR